MHRPALRHERDPLRRPDAACAEIARLLGIAPDGLADHPDVLVGGVDEIVDTLQERRKRCGVNHVTVQQAELERVAPMVERLAGT